MGVSRGKAREDTGVRVGADMATFWSGAHHESVGRVVAFSSKLVVVGGGGSVLTIIPNRRWYHVAMRGMMGPRECFWTHDGTAWQPMDPMREKDVDDGVCKTTQR